jgi:hypothetical protein
VAAGLAPEIDNARPVLLMRVGVQVHVDKNRELASAMRALLRRRTLVHAEDKYATFRRPSTQCRTSYAPAGSISRAKRV